jgi:hypothetical protein
MTSSLRWPLTKSTHGTRCSRANRRIAALNPSVIFPSGAVEAIGNPSWRVDVAQQPTGMLKLRHVDVAVHPVDALHLEHHMIVEDIGDGAR